MNDEEKVKHAKELAAREAFKAYGATLQKLLADYGLTLSLINATTHVHTAILLDGQTAVGVKCQWDFEVLPEKVAEMLRQRKAEGLA